MVKLDKMVDKTDRRDKMVDKVDRTDKSMRGCAEMDLSERLNPNVCCHDATTMHNDSKRDVVSKCTCHQRTNQWTNEQTETSAQSRRGYYRRGGKLTICQRTLWLYTSVILLCSGTLALPTHRIEFRDPRQGELTLLDIYKV